MRNRLILYIAIPVTLLTGVISGVVIGTGINTKSKGESFEYLQTLAYKAIRDKCHSDGHAEACDKLLIHDAYGNLNGESTTPDGYVFNFTDNYKKESTTLAYRVAILNNTKITVLEQLDPSKMSDVIPD